jgi:hypothetical protein
MYLAIASPLCFHVDMGLWGANEIPIATADIVNIKCKEWEEGRVFFSFQTQIEKTNSDLIEGELSLVHYHCFDLIFFPF